MSKFAKLNIYLASRYSRRLELCERRETLEREKWWKVSSRWLDGNHEIGDPRSRVEGDSGSRSPEAAELRSQFALEDLEDIENSDILIAFTEPPWINGGRGGRHVELGFAICLGIEVYVIGHRENVFCWLPTIRFFETFDECLEFMRSEFCIE